MSTVENRLSRFGSPYLRSLNNRFEGGGTVVQRKVNRLLAYIERGIQGRCHSDRVMQFKFDLQLDYADDSYLFGFTILDNDYFVQRVPRYRMNDDTDDLIKAMADEIVSRILLTEDIWRESRPRAR